MNVGKSSQINLIHALRFGILISFIVLVFFIYNYIVYNSGNAGHEVADFSPSWLVSWECGVAGHALFSAMMKSYFWPAIIAIGLVVLIIALSWLPKREGAGPVLVGLSGLGVLPLIPIFSRDFPSLTHGIVSSACAGTIGASLSLLTIASIYFVSLSLVFGSAFFLLDLVRGQYDEV